MAKPRISEIDFTNWSVSSLQLAEAYETDSKVISNNFNRNADRYTEGKHFYRLTGDELKAFKACHQIEDNLKFAPFVLLWTEKGALLHAKSLNTDKAWEVYDYLVESIQHFLSFQFVQSIGQNFSGELRQQKYICIHSFLKIPFPVPAQCVQIALQDVSGNVVYNSHGSDEQAFITYERCGSHTTVSGYSYFGNSLLEPS